MSFDSGLVGNASGSMIGGGEFNPLSSPRGYGSGNGGGGVSRFAVYCPDLSTNEDNEADKLLYYFPDDETIDTKMSHIGLAEAMINFTRTFSPDCPCETARTEKQCSVFFEPEPGYWMLLTVNNPPLPNDQNPLAFDETFHDESVLRAVLEQAYDTFRFFHGTMEALASHYSVGSLRDALEIFFPPYLVGLDFSSIGLFDALDGIRFVPIARDAFLHASHCVARIENRNSAIRHSVALFDGYLVWAGVSQQDIRCLYRYLIRSVPLDTLLFSPHESGALDGFAGSGRIRAVSIKKNATRTQRGFLNGPESLRDEKTVINCPCVYLRGGSEELFLVVYKFNELILCMFVDSSVAFDVPFYRSLEKSLLEELPSLLETIKVAFIAPSSSENIYKYVYFNHMNLAFKSSLFLRGNQITSKLMRVLEYIHTQFRNSLDDIKEYCIKVERVGWVIGRNISEREFYVVFDSKNSSLVEVSESMREASSLFFHQAFID